MLLEFSPIIWKEWRELFRQRGMRGGLTSWAILVAVMGIIMPLQVGAEWLRNPILLVLWAWMPIFSVISLVCDSFAGERERHTLETLLATRLSDQSILFGKILVVALYGWSIEICGILLGAVVVNLNSWNGKIQFYPLDMLAGILSLNILGVLLVSGFGVLVSLRAGTVRQAFQQISWIFYAIIFVPIIFGQVIPSNMRERILEILQTLPGPAFFLSTLSILLLANGIIFMVARKNFKRSNLILEQ